MFVFDVPHILLYTLILLYHIALPKIFSKAGYEKPVHGYIPIYNILILLKLLKKPWWWILLLCVPGVNLLMLVIINVNVSFGFGKRKFTDALIAIVVPHYIVAAVAFQDKFEWKGPLIWKNKKEKGMIREWGDAVLFAIVAAGIIRGFFFEAFTIPTGSMEKDLLIGDYLFVNKVAYGPKLPQTPVAVPFFHNNIPGTYTRCYVEWFKMDYHRLPGYTDVERNDIMVFNYPAGDTALLGQNPEGSELQGHNYHQYVKDEALFLAGSRSEMEKNPGIYMAKARKNILEKNTIAHLGIKTQGWIVRPTDKKENYIKRCVGIPGDTMEIIDGELIINGQDAYLDENAQFMYKFRRGTETLTPRKVDKLKEDYDINPTTEFGFINDSTGIIFVTKEHYNKINSMKFHDGLWVDWKKRRFYLEDLESRSRKYLPIFPNDPIVADWTEDNMGPWYLPKRGDEIELNAFNLAFYRRAIESYEKNKLEVQNGDVYINGEKTNTYTFKMNYYWLMGDNRHNSLDSRMWGYVPEDHVVGKASFIWFSREREPGFEGTRWDRIFQSAH